MQALFHIIDSLTGEQDRFVTEVGNGPIKNWTEEAFARRAALDGIEELQHDCVWVTFMDNDSVSFMLIERDTSTSKLDDVYITGFMYMTFIDNPEFLHF